VGGARVLARKAGVRDVVIAVIRERRAPAGLTPAEAQVHGYAFAIEPTPGEFLLPV
jgi:hypothetical protein